MNFTSYEANSKFHYPNITPNSLINLLSKAIFNNYGKLTYYILKKSQITKSKIFSADTHSNVHTSIMISWTKAIFKKPDMYQPLAGFKGAVRWYCLSK